LSVFFAELLIDYGPLFTSHEGKPVKSINLLCSYLIKAQEQIRTLSRMPKINMRKNEVQTIMDHYTLRRAVSSTPPPPYPARTES